LRLFALALSHLDAKRGLPRRLPCEYRHHDQKLHSIWSDLHSPSENAVILQTHFTQEHPATICFLETWIEKSQGEDVSLKLIADTLLDLWRRFHRSRKFEGLNDIMFANLAATVILSCSHSLDASASGIKILRLAFRLACRKVDNLIFKTTICRLEKHDIILALVIFSEVIQSTSEDETDENTIIWDMFTDVGMEIWSLEKKDGEALYDWVLQVRTCLHIVLYMASHAEWFDEDESIFMCLKQIIEDQIGKRGAKSIWDCVGLGVPYKRLERELHEEWRHREQVFKAPSKVGVNGPSSKKPLIPKRQRMVSYHPPVSDIQVSTPPIGVNVPQHASDIEASKLTNKPVGINGSSRSPPLPKPRFYGHSNGSKSGNMQSIRATHRTAHRTGTGREKQWARLRRLIGV
jgi:hypothetical protein